MMPCRGPGSCWLVDLDGTVVDSERRFYEAYCGALMARRRPVVEITEFRKLMYAGRLLTSLDMSKADASRFWQEVMTRFVADEHASRPLPGAKSALARLRREGSRVGLVTGRVCSEEALRRELMAVHLDDCFDVVMTSAVLQLADDSRQTKADLFERSLMLLERSAEVTTYVTDWPPDLDDAREYGFGWCVGVTTGGFDPESFAKAPRALTSPSLATLVLQP
jgi:phosphoglycolate phosphatase-like HAD superfamily hydrolase